MTASRRLATALAALAVPIALAAGCASATSARPAATRSGATPPTASFTVMGLAFRYPASWQRSRTWASDQPGFSGLMVYLSSTTRLKAPCITSTSSRPDRPDLRIPGPRPAAGRGPRQVDRQRLPEWRMPKPNTTIAGRRAVETRTTRGWCAPLRATETITVIIPRAAPGTLVPNGRLPPLLGPAPTRGADIVHAEIDTNSQGRLKSGIPKFWVAADDLLHDLGGAVEARLDVAEAPEPTIASESIGLVLPPAKAGLHLVGVSRGVRGAI